MSRVCCPSSRSLFAALAAALAAFASVGPAAGDELAAEGGALVAAGAAVLVVDAGSGAERFAGGWVDRPTPPGSIFKLVTALAAGGAQAAQLNEALRCPAPPSYGPRCGHPHGSLTFEGAIAQSCNAYFAQLGAAVGGAALLQAAQELGLHRLPAATSVTTASAAALLGATGEGVRVTPREVAGLLRAIATGRLPAGPVPGAALLPRLRDGMRLSAQQGTSRGAKAPGDPIALAGKTGTAVAGAGTVGWFAAFAPAAAPSVIFVVAQRDHRGAEVAQSSRALISAYFHGGGRR